MSIRKTVGGVLCTLILVSASHAQDVRFARATMNFELKPSSIVQTVNEQTDNEKEVELGDVDNDGDLDVVVVAARSFFSSGARRNKLYLNNNGVFNEVTATAAAPFLNVDVSRNGFLRDYDGDGWLDIIVVNDAIAGPTRGTTRFYSNKHPGGVFSHFEDETNQLNGAVGDACGGFQPTLTMTGAMTVTLEITLVARKIPSTSTTVERSRMLRMPMFPPTGTTRSMLLLEI